jgi:hypothetical protein
MPTKKTRVELIHRHKTATNKLLQNKKKISNLVKSIEDGKVNVMEFARMRWIDRHGNENSNTSTGYGYSKKNSIFGESAVYYRVRGTLYYRSSSVKLKDNGNFKTKKYGTNKKRYLIQNKTQKP